MHPCFVFVLDFDLYCRSIKVCFFSGIVNQSGAVYGLYHLGRISNVSVLDKRTAMFVFQA